MSEFYSLQMYKQFYIYFINILDSATTHEKDLFKGHNTKVQFEQTVQNCVFKGGKEQKIIAL